jgi:hypothetical protein
MPANPMDNTWILYIQTIGRNKVFLPIRVPFSGGLNTGINASKKMQKLVAVPLIPALAAVIITVVFTMYQQTGVVTAIITPLLGVTAGSIFFIQDYLNNRNETRQKRQRHFERLRDIVFKSCIIRKFVVTSSMQLLRESWDDLFLHMTGVLYDLDEHNVTLALSHLDSYNDTSRHLNEIRINEDHFNLEVNEFIGNLESFVVQKIRSVNPAFHECDGKTNESLCYALDNINSYLFRLAQKRPLVLLITDDDGRITPRLQISPGSQLIAKADHNILINLKNVLDLSVIPEIDNKIQMLTSKRNNIIKKFNEQFLPVVKNVISLINEEEPIKGGCGLSYCPKA